MQGTGVLEQMLHPRPPGGGHDAIRENGRARRLLPLLAQRAPSKVTLASGANAALAIEVAR